MLTSQPSALAVHSSLNVKSVTELVALLKREPGKYNYGSIGNGSLSHLAMEAVALASGTKLVHIPYASSPQAMTALLRGDVQIACLPAIAVTPQVASGNVAILAVTTDKRSRYLPEIPTLRKPASTSRPMHGTAWSRRRVRRMRSSRRSSARWPRR